MRAVLIVCLVVCFIFSCKSNYKTGQAKSEISNAVTANDTVRIADDKTEYENYSYRTRF